MHGAETMRFSPGRSKASLLALVLLVGGASAQELTISDIEAVLNERMDSIRTLQVNVTIGSDAIGRVDEFTLGTSYIAPTTRQVTLENGKFYAERENVAVEDGYRENKYFRDAWNGSERYEAVMLGSTEARSSIHGEFSFGGAIDTISMLNLAGIKAVRIVGGYDPNSPNEIGETFAPLDVINRVRHTGPKGIEKADVVKLQRNGSDLYVLRMIKLPSGVVKVEHILDPSLGFNPVESRFYDRDGNLRWFVERSFLRNDDGTVLPKSMNIVKTARQLKSTTTSIAKMNTSIQDEVAGFYDDADPDEIRLVTTVNFSDFRINEEIDPRIYEKENVFFVHGEIWDERSGKQIQQSVEEIQRQSLKNVQRYILESEHAPDEADSSIAEKATDSSNAADAVGQPAENQKAPWFLIGAVILGVGVSTITAAGLLMRKHPKQ